MIERVQPIILAGGSGTRLWPVSRESFPKQFQPLTHDLSTYQQALLRVSDPDLFESPIVITSREFRHFAARQAREIGISTTVILEPLGRDSAGAIAAATSFVHRRTPDAFVLAMAADHVILDDDLFQHAIHQGLHAARAGRIVVFGLPAGEPKTSYGYIRPGPPLGETSDVLNVEAFVEKPDLATAERYVRDGYLWNSGNFLFRADAMIEGLHSYAAPVIAAAAAAVTLAHEESGVFTLDHDAFARTPKTSIDYALVEKAKNVAVVRCRFRWSDIGAWDALWQMAERDPQGNAVRGSAHLIDCRNCLIHTDGTVAAVAGGENLVVVATGDVVMVTSHDRAQGVKELVSLLKAAERPEATRHRRDYRGWGCEETINRGDAFTVKRLTLDPGSSLTPDAMDGAFMHWIVVEGAGTLTLDGRPPQNVCAGQFVEMTTGMHASLVNTGDAGLEVISVEARNV